MYLARVSPEYVHEVCNPNSNYINVSRYEQCGFGFIKPVNSEVGLLASSRTITRFITDITLKGSIAQLREYVWYGDPTPTDLISPKDYKEYGITTLGRDCISTDQEEIGALRTDRAVIHYILVPPHIMITEEKQTPLALADTGNRTDLGSGGLRDINPENGRCDLLPASAITQYMSAVALTAHPEYTKNPDLVSAFHDIMKYMDWGDFKFLNQALTSMIIHHWYKTPHSEANSVPQDVMFAQAMMDLSVHYKNGALKYEERNWERGLPVHSFIDSAVRHLCKEMLGWTDEPHDMAIMWNLFGAIWTIQHYPHLNDLPSYKDYRKDNKNEAKKETTSDGNTSENNPEKEDIKKDNPKRKKWSKPHPETCFG